MKAMIILSTLLNVLLVGGAGTYYALRSDDAKFFISYNQKSDANRAAIRNADVLFDSAPIEGEEEFKKLLVDEELKKRYQDARSPQEVQELLVNVTRSTNAMLEERRREADNSIERMIQRSREYADFQGNLSSERAEVDRARKEFGENKQAYEANSRNETLNRLVVDVDKVKKVETIVPLISGRPVDDIIYILQNVKDSTKRAAVFNGLKPDEQAAIKARDTNPMATPAGSLGK